MYINSSNPFQINLMDELVAINKENTLKKRLQGNISVSYMSKFNEDRKVERMKVFKQIQVYIKRVDYEKLEEYCKKNNNSNVNMKKNFNDKIEYKKIEKIPKGQLENSKDRLQFLNKLITSQTNGYDPVKNFMQAYRMKNKVIQERRSRERDLRLKFLRSKQIRKDRSNLVSNANKVNRVREQREIDRIKRDTRNRDKRDAILKKKKVSWNSNDEPNFVEEQEIIVKQSKSSRTQRKEDILYKDGYITDNTDFLSSGMYELPKYSRAIVFKFDINFNILNDKVVDLIDKEGDLLLHLNIRDNKQIILNSNINDNWGKEIRGVEREFLDKMELKILVKSDYYKVLLDNKVVTFFIQRKKSNINFFSINEDVRNFVFKVM